MGATGPEVSAASLRYPLVASRKSPLLGVVQLGHPHVGLATWVLSASMARSGSRQRLGKLQVKGQTPDNRRARRRDVRQA